MDRLLQFEMDRKDREDAEKVDEIRQALAATAVEVSVDFIARETLLEWRKISVDVLARPLTWDRFERIARRHLVMAGIERDEDVVRFMDDVPRLLGRTLECVGEERVREYLESAKARARAAMKEYLT
jgi:hypothetical protein